MYTAFICLGGTGTQLGTAIGNLYPLLKLSGIGQEPFSMFIMDKDTNSGIYKACTNALERYEACKSLLPFDSLPPFELSPTVYQDLQGDLRNANYTVMDLIGNDIKMKELAAMCWKEEKRNESIRDGNNRDPSRGSLDALVCLEHLEKSSLFEGKSGQQGLKNLVEKYGSKSVRIVILGGATGGMGSSLIVPLAEKLYASFSGIHIDLVLLGTYFEIPQRNAPPLGAVDIDNIGTSLDSFYRAADQIEELHNMIKDSEKWHVYYAAMPGFDNTAGKFEKNGAVKRKAHLLELAATLASFYMGREDCKARFYETILAYDKPSDLIDWTEIPLGANLKRPAENFLKLISVLASMVYPSLCADQKSLKGNNYLKPYFKKNPTDDMTTISSMKDLLKKWLDNVKPYFEFWHEIQLNTHLGYKDGRQVVEFFNYSEMSKLVTMLDTEQIRSNEFLPLWGGKSWMALVGDIDEIARSEKSKLKEKETEEPAGKLKWMIDDIWVVLNRKEG
jgi:hypothetical protein